MAFTSQEEANIRLLLLSFQNGKGIADLSEADHETLSGALIEVLQNGVSKKTSIAKFFTGSPAGVKDSLAALEADSPGGAEGTYVTSDTGHWYFWNGSTWEDGGLYQAPLDNVQTFSSTILVNPHTAGKTPRFLGDVAINTTTLEIWKANALTAAVGSWSCISEGYKAGRVITKAHGLSAITQTTFFTCYGALAHADRPTDLPAAIDESCYGLHIDSNVGDTSAYQMVIGYTTGVKYERRKVSGTWGAWMGLNVANNLTTTVEGYTLDARQGKALNDAIALKENAANKKTIINDSDTEFPTSKAIKTALDAKVETSNVANNLTTTDAGMVLDARQGPVITAALGTKVSKTGDETVAGVKTFTSSPIVPTPTTDMQSSTKKYVDDADALKIDKENIANNLTTTAEGYTLDARQGKVLNDAIALKENAANKKTIINDSDTEFPTSKAVRTEFIGTNRTLAEVLSTLDARILSLETFIKGNLGDVTVNTINIIKGVNQYGSDGNAELKASGAPAAIPDYIGQQYTDTANGNIYKAKNNTAIADWVKIN